MTGPGQHTVSIVVSDLLGRAQRASVTSRVSNTPSYNFNYTQIYLKFYELQVVDIASQLQASRAHVYNVPLNLANSGDALAPLGHHFQGFHGHLHVVGIGVDDVFVIHHDAHMAGEENKMPA